MELSAPIEGTPGCTLLWPSLRSKPPQRTMIWVFFPQYLLSSSLRVSLNTSFSLFLQCSINTNPCSITWWVVGLERLHSTERGNRRNTDLSKWLIKHKQLCLAGRLTHSEPRLALLPKFQLCLCSPGPWPLCTAHRDTKWLSPRLLARAGLQRLLG